MFRKLVSYLPYSPTLISDIGFYALRLKKENVALRTALLFVILTLAGEVFVSVPTVGTEFTIGFASVILFIVLFFYLRTRQLQSEIKIIRRDFNAGII